MCVCVCVSLQPLHSSDFASKAQRLCKTTLTLQVSAQSVFLSEIFPGNSQHIIPTHRLAAELEEEEVTEGAAAAGRAGAVPVSEEVLESLRGMEQQVQVALLELKKKDQQLAQERSCTGRFKVSNGRLRFTHSFILARHVPALLLA